MKKVVSIIKNIDLISVFEKTAIVFIFSEVTTLFINSFLNLPVELFNILIRPIMFSLAVGIGLNIFDSIDRVNEKPEYKHDFKILNEMSTKNETVSNEKAISLEKNREDRIQDLYAEKNKLVETVNVEKNKQKIFSNF